MAKNRNELPALHAKRQLAPPEDVTDSAPLIAAPEAILQKAMSSEGTHTVAERCREAFTAPEAKKRFLKNRFFYVPLRRS